MMADNREYWRRRSSGCFTVNAAITLATGAARGGVTAFQPLSAIAAIGLVEAAGIQDARQMIADFAAAGLLKTYALAIETVEEGGQRSTIRGSAILVELWHRIVDEGRLDDVWRGGMVRLTAVPPQAAITGISFSEKHVERLVEQHRPAVPEPPVLVRSAGLPRASEKPSLKASMTTNVSRDVVAVPQSAELVTVEQAMAVLLGRTKINELMCEGVLDRVKVGRRTLIKVSSIRSLVQVRT